MSSRVYLRSAYFSLIASFSLYQCANAESNNWDGPLNAEWALNKTLLVLACLSEPNNKKNNNSTLRIKPSGPIKIVCSIKLKCSNAQTDGNI